MARDTRVGGGCFLPPHALTTPQMPCHHTHPTPPSPSPSPPHHPACSARHAAARACCLPPAQAQPWRAARGWRWSAGGAAEAARGGGSACGQHGGGQPRLCQGGVQGTFRERGRDTTEGRGGGMGQGGCMVPAPLLVCCMVCMAATACIAICTGMHWHACIVHPHESAASAGVPPPPHAHTHVRSLPCWPATSPCRRWCTTGMSTWPQSCGAVMAKWWQWWGWHIWRALSATGSDGRSKRSPHAARARRGPVWCPLVGGYSTPWHQVRMMPLLASELLAPHLLLALHPFTPSHECNP